MAAIGLYINSTEQGFTVRGVNNNFFPDNATLAYPANSVILITDESDMATFRSASNYDVLFSALIKDININGEQVTKDNIIETFNEAANKPSGGGGNPDAFTSVKYDGTKSLIFYNDKGDEVANVDVTPFIKDGMVSNVEILNGNLVITFNTDSGKQPITIPLTDIFNPNNYYDKTTADSTFATQVVVNEEIAARIQGDADINTALQAKADKTDTYTKTQVDDALALKQDASTAFSGDYNDLTNKPTIPTVPTNVSAFTNDAGYLTQHQSLSDYYTKTETDNAIATAMEDIDLSDYVDVTTFNKKELATAKALTQLNDTKADKTEIPDVSTFATKTELNAKANSADLATVATSGSYNDLTDKPVIPEGAVVDAALSDTSENPVQNKVVKGAIDEAKAYYVDFAAMSVRGITDADWDGLVAAINAHRPILVKVGTANGYVNVITAFIFDNNIILVGADEGNASQYTFTKNGSNDYSVSTSTEQFVSQSEKDAWNAKQDALQYYSEAEYENGGGRGLINVYNGKTYNASIDAETGSSDATTKVSLYAEGEAGSNTLNVSPTGVSINDAKVLTENDIDPKEVWDTIDEKEEVIATALTQLNQDVSDIDAKEEVISTSLNTLNENVENLSNDKQDKLQFYSENEYDEETGEEATAMIQVIGQGDYQGDSSGINVQPFIVELGTSSEGEDTTLIIESNGVTINGKRVLTENDLESAKAYYVDFGVLTTQGIHDADWDGLVNAINAHRPIYAVLGGEYYVSECLAQSGNQIILTASNHLAHFFYTFTKNDSENYLFDYVTNPYVSQTEKDAWSAKQDALVSGTNIKTVNNQSIIGSGNIDIQFTQTQADWNETDTTSSAFIKNKPDLSGKANASDVYTKTEIDAMIGNINTILASI